MGSSFRKSKLEEAAPAEQLKALKRDLESGYRNLEHEININRRNLNYEKVYSKCIQEVTAKMPIPESFKSVPSDVLGRFVSEIGEKEMTSDTRNNLCQSIANYYAKRIALSKVLENLTDNVLRLKKDAQVRQLLQSIEELAKRLLKRFPSSIEVARSQSELVRKKPIYL